MSYKTHGIYSIKINKLFLVTSCFSLWELMSNQELQKFNVCRKHFFPANLGKFGQTFFTPSKNSLFLHLCFKCVLLLFLKINQ